MDLKRCDMWDPHYRGMGQARPSMIILWGMDGRCNGTGLVHPPQARLQFLSCMSRKLPWSDLQEWIMY